MATPSAKPHRRHSSSGASAAQFSLPRAISPSPKKLKGSFSAPESVKRTNFRPATVTITETNEAGTTAREMGSCLPERKGTHRGKSSPHLWTRPSVSAAPHTAMVARAAPAPQPDLLSLAQELLADAERPRRSALLFSSRPVLRPQEKTSSGWFYPSPRRSTPARA